MQTTLPFTTTSKRSYISGWLRWLCAAISCLKTKRKMMWAPLGKKPAEWRCSNSLIIHKHTQRKVNITIWGVWCTRKTKCPWLHSVLFDVCFGFVCLSSVEYDFRQQEKRFLEVLNQSRGNDASLKLNQILNFNLLRHFKKFRVSKVKSKKLSKTLMKWLMRNLPQMKTTWELFQTRDNTFLPAGGATGAGAFLTLSWD